MKVVITTLVTTFHCSIYTYLPQQNQFSNVHCDVLHSLVSKCSNFQKMTIASLMFVSLIVFNYYYFCTALV